MTSIVEVTRVRLSPSVVDEICDAYPLDMRMTKVVAPDSVMVKGKKFASGKGSSPLTRTILLYCEHSARSLGISWFPFALNDKSSSKLTWRDLRECAIKIFALRFKSDASFYQFF
jgi:hypothetical protein